MLFCLFIVISLNHDKNIKLSGILKFPFFLIWLLYDLILNFNTGGTYISFPNPSAKIVFFKSQNIFPFWGKEDNIIIDWILYYQILWLNIHHRNKEKKLFYIFGFQNDSYECLFVCYIIFSHQICHSGRMITWEEQPWKCTQSISLHHLMEWHFQRQQSMLMFNFHYLEIVCKILEKKNI